MTGGQPEDPRLVVLDSEVSAPDYTEGKHEDMENFTFAFLGQHRKVLTSEKKGGLEVVAIDRSPFNLNTVSVLCKITKNTIEKYKK